MHILSCHLICSKYFYYLLQSFFICSNYFLIAASLFNLQQLFYLQDIPFGPPYFKVPLIQIGIYLKPQINYCHRFFLHEWTFRSHETNESAHLNRIFFKLLSQCLFVVHYGNSLVYAFAELSIEQSNTQNIFYILYANFCPHQASNRFVLNRCVCRFESVWLMSISPVIMS